MKLLIDIVGILLELIITLWFFDATMSRKSGTKRYIYLFSGVFILLNIVAVSIFRSGLPLLITLTLTIILISSQYDQLILLKAIWVIFLVAISAFGEMLTGIAATILLGSSVEVLNENLNFYFYGVWMSKLLLLVFLIPIRVKTWKISSFTKNRSYILFACMPLSSITVIICVLKQAILITDKETLSFMTLAIIFLITSNLIAFFLTERYVRLENEQANIQSKQQHLQHQLDYYKKLADEYRQSSRVVHDIKNSLFATLADLQNHKYCNAEGMIKELCNSALAPYEIQITGNDAVNALLSSKLQKIKSLDIVFTHNIIIAKSNVFSDEDLCVLLGNALDNAIEACERIALQEQRKINVVLEQKENRLLMEVANSVDLTVKHKNNNLKSAKINELLHGFGIENMKTIVSKYNGNILFNQKESEFYVRAVLENVLSTEIQL